MQWALYGVPLQSTTVQCVDPPNECSTKNVQLLGESSAKPRIVENAGLTEITCNHSTIGPFIKLNEEGYLINLLNSPLPLACTQGLFTTGSYLVWRAECSAGPLCARCKRDGIPDKAIIQKPNNLCLLASLEKICSSGQQLKLNEGSITVDGEKNLICSKDGLWTFNSLDGETHTITKTECLDRPHLLWEDYGPVS
uniref:Sushi domain-containing protein n=1 Tax=Steinernema glaseri TaxID=37863 RepID=A0A1I7YLV7_9BILA